MKPATPQSTMENRDITHSAQQSPLNVYSSSKYSGESKRCLAHIPGILVSADLATLTLSANLGTISEQHWPHLGFITRPQRSHVESWPHSKFIPSHTAVLTASVSRGPRTSTEQSLRDQRTTGGKHSVLTSSFNLRLSLSASKIVR